MKSPQGRLRIFEEAREKMKTLIICALFLLASGAVQAQNLGTESLRALNFLQGVWTLDNAGYTDENLEFHWSTREGNPVIVGRRWSGYEKGCPWCVAQSAMLARYDATLNQIRLHFVDREQHVREFHLDSVDRNSAVFSTDERIGLPTYRLTFTRVRGNTLQLKLFARSDWDTDFLPWMQAGFQRR